MHGGTGHIATALAAVMVAAAPARAQPVHGELGGYERQALDEAMSRAPYELEPAPEGKRVRAIHVQPLEVFADDESFLTFFNRFHITSLPHTIAREVLLRPGALYDQALVEESERNLRNPLFFTLVVIVPLRSPVPGTVDLLVITRDVWSLRTNSDFEVQDGALTRLTLALSENNVLGRRKTFAAVFDMDLGSYFIGPRYIDPNMGGTRVELTAEGGAVFNRATDRFEGARGIARLRYPLWSLAQHWGGGMTLSQADQIVRVFQGTDVLPYDDPDTTEVVEAIPREYRLRQMTIDTELVHQSGDGLKRRLVVGHRLRVQRPSVTPGSPATGEVRDSFIEDVLPRSERSSALVLAVQLFTPRFITFRNIETFDLPEVRRIGPDLRLELEPAHELFGSEANFVRVSVTSDWRVAFDRDAWLRMTASVSNRVEERRSVDNELIAELSGATPRVRGFRLAARGLLGIRANEIENRLFVLGGETGLRGYQIGAFTGQAIAVTNLELRTLPRRLWFMRWGGIAFWDMGHAAAGIDDLRMHNDLGFGLRVLAPQTGSSIYRLDWAFPLNGASAGWPGRFSLGFSQVF